MTPLEILFMGNIQKIAKKQSKYLVKRILLEFFSSLFTFDKKLIKNILRNCSLQEKKLFSQMQTMNRALNSENEALRISNFSKLSAMNNKFKLKRQ